MAEMTIMLALALLLLSTRLRKTYNATECHVMEEMHTRFLLLPMDSLVNYTVDNCLTSLARAGNV